MIKPNTKQFIVLASPRTGSTLLISFLDSHPSIAAGYEILHSLRGRCYKEIVQKGFSIAEDNAEVKARGFKFFYNHPLDLESNEVLHHLASNPSLHVIHLKRRNLLRILVSTQIALQQGGWNSVELGAQKISEKKSVILDFENLKSGFEQIYQWESEGDRIFENHPMISIDYEELAEQPARTFARVCRFLGVPYHKPRSPLVKQNPERLNELVENYAELRQAFLGTKWKRFFR
jgi:LPS sulfotransferase NodH